MPSKNDKIEAAHFQLFQSDIIYYKCDNTDPAGYDTIPFINRLVVGLVQQGLSAARSSRTLFLRSDAVDKSYSLCKNLKP